MKLDIAVIGLGTFGFELAVQLAQNGHGVLAIDIDEKKINAIKDLVSVAVVADVVEEQVLRKLEMEKFDIIIFSMSSALETIILAITHLKKMNAKYIIGKANTRLKKEILLKLGADEVVLPEIATAIRLTDKITHPSILEKFQIDYKNSLLEVKIPERFIGKSLKKLDLRSKHGINVVMLKRNNETRIISDPSLLFQEGDELFVIGDEKIIKKIFS